jgi:hypothetical protein
MTMRPKVPLKSPEKSRAFREQFALAPTGNGILDGLAFAVKDIIDVAGRRTGCGNPRWPETHPPAAVHAVCVEQLCGRECDPRGLAFCQASLFYEYGNLSEATRWAEIANAIDSILDGVTTRGRASRFRSIGIDGLGRIWRGKSVCLDDG